MRIALIGAGGLAKEMLEIAELCGHQVIGTFASYGTLEGVPHLGYLDELLAKRHLFDAVMIAVGVHSIDRIKARETIASFLMEHNINQTVLISPYSNLIHKSVKIGMGTYIHHDVIISCDAVIGSNVIINTSARIGHDCHIGNNVYVGPNVFIGGSSKIGGGVLIGASSSIKDGITVGDDCVLGIGSVVLKKMKSGMIIMPSLGSLYSI